MPPASNGSKPGEGEALRYSSSKTVREFSPSGDFKKRRRELRDDQKDWDRDHAFFPGAEVFQRRLKRMAGTAPILGTHIRRMLPRTRQRRRSDRKNRAARLYLFFGFLSTSV